MAAATAVWTRAFTVMAAMADKSPGPLGAEARPESGHHMFTLQPKFVYYRFAAKYWGPAN